MLITITGSNNLYYMTEISDNSHIYQFNIASMFQLELINLENKSISYIECSNFRKSSCKVYEDNTLKISYYDYDSPGILKVHINGIAGENREADLSIDVVCKIPGYGLKSVKFPILSTKVLGSSNDNQVMAIPATKIGGAYYRKPALGSSYKSFNYPGNLGMQYVSLYDYQDGHNLYIQQLDPYTYPKDFLFAGNSAGTRTELAWRSFTINGDEEFNSYYQQYRTRIASLISGDWYDASVKYREWATGQFWATHRGKLLQDPSGRHSSIAKKNRFTFLQTPISVDGPSFVSLKQSMDTFISTMAALFNTTVSKEEVVSIWYDWHRQRSLITPYTPFPDWTSLGGLTEGLADAVAEAQSDGYSIVPYTYHMVQFPLRDETWHKANSYDLNYIKVYEYQKLVSIATLVEANNAIYNGIDEPGNIIDSQRKELNDSIFKVNTGIVTDAGFKGIYYDVYPSEAPINYNPLASIKGGTPRHHLGFVDNHLRFKSFATGYLGSDFVQIGEYGNEISFMEQDLPNCYRAELATFWNDGVSIYTGDVVIQNNTGIITAPLLSTVYHEYGRIGNFDYMGSSQDVGRIYHDGAIPGILLIDVPGSLPIIGNVVPYGILDYAAYFPAAVDVLSMMASFIKSSGASDKYLIYGQKLRPISGSREYLMTRYDAPATGVAIQSTAWRAQDGKIGVISSSANTAGSQRINLVSGKYLASGTAYDLYIASGTYAQWHDFVYSGRYTGHYDDVVNLETTHMIKVLEFRP